MRPDSTGGHVTSCHDYYPLCHISGCEFHLSLLMFAPLYPRLSVLLLALASLLLSVLLSYGRESLVHHRVNAQQHLFRTVQPLKVSQSIYGVAHVLGDVSLLVCIRVPFHSPNFEPFETTSVLRPAILSAPVFRSQRAEIHRLVTQEVYPYQSASEFLAGPR